jgi:transcriptional regulator with XRE-family HTH domain
MLRDNLKVAFASQNLYVKEVSAKSGVKKGTIDNWLSEAKTKEPRAIDLYSVCKAVNITVEQAIEGEAGADYVRQWVRQDGGVWEPPENIADIVDGLKLLDERELDMIRGAVNAAVDAKKGREKRG